MSHLPLLSDPASRSVVSGQTAAHDDTAVTRRCVDPYDFDSRMTAEDFFGDDEPELVWLVLSVGPGGRSLLGICSSRDGADEHARIAVRAVRDPNTRVSVQSFPLCER